MKRFAVLANLDSGEFIRCGEYDSPWAARLHAFLYRLLSLHAEEVWVRDRWWE